MNSFIIYDIVSYYLLSTHLAMEVHWTYPVLGTHLLTAHALLHAARPAPDQTVSLQGLVILDVLRELAEGVGARRALCAAEEGHGGNARCAKWTV